MIRLFVGIELPDGLRERLAALEIGLDGVRWVFEDNLHLTLRFIGEVDPGQAEDVVEALEGVRAAPFEVALDGLGMFGTGAKLRALWVGVAPSPALQALHDKVDRALQRAGLPPEGRRYTPHVTLARIMTGAAKSRLGHFLEHNAGLRADPFPVDTFTLFESFLSSEGSVYEAVERFGFDEREA